MTILAAAKAGALVRPPENASLAGKLQASPAVAAERNQAAECVSSFVAIGASSDQRQKSQVERVDESEW